LPLANDRATPAGCSRAPHSDGTGLQFLILVDQRDGTHRDEMRDYRKANTEFISIARRLRDDFDCGRARVQLDDYV
jgi:hypothetical protein